MEIKYRNAVSVLQPHIGYFIFHTYVPLSLLHIIYYEIIVKASTGSRKLSDK